jgi:hypothetical protein
MQSTVFRVVTSCISGKSRLFGRTYRLYLHGKKISQASTSKKYVANLSACHLFLTGFLLRLLFDLEDGDNIFLRRDGIFSEMRGVYNPEDLFFIRMLLRITTFAVSIWLSSFSS